MDLLDRLLGHDRWTTQQLIRACQPLAEAQLDQPFDVDSRSLRECFRHIVHAMEIWNDLLYERPVRPAPAAGDPPPSLADLLAAHAAAADELAHVARQIARDQRWDDTFTDVLDQPPQLKTFGGTIAHVVTHSMHHRAQAMWMMEQLGLRDHLEGDVLSWEQLTRRSAG